jgi:type II secretory pathway pseudopilin PulG
MLIVVAVMGAGMAAFGQLASDAMQREKEAELLFRGNQYRLAIESYYRKGQAYPKTLAELLQDKRYPMPVRHLRRLYRDPMTGEDWALVEAPGGGIMGVYSASDAAPFQSAGFPLEIQHFTDAPRYRDWQFVHKP